MTLDPSSRRARLDVAPRRPLIDTELHVRVLDLPPLRQVTVRAESVDAAGQAWRAHATFTADSAGTVDLARAAPLSGSYQDADAMGLIWSMEPVGRLDPGLARDRLASVPLRLLAEADGGQRASTQVRRSFMPDGMERTEIRELGLVGVLFHPEGAGPWPGVMHLGGAEGGLHEDDAALLSAHGFAVLALAYYGMPGLPQTLQRVPVEYFGRALDYLGRHPQVAAGGLTVMGVSKGGEAALLTGATYPSAVRAVISVVGSGLVTQGISQSVLTGSLLEILSTPVASWTYQGHELPYLPNVVTPQMEAAVAAGGPVSLGWAAPDLSCATQVAQAAIPVERIAGPVLLISGEDDQTYGPAFQEAAAQRLARLGHAHSWKHLIHKQAGHLIAAVPYRPTTQSVFPGPGVPFQFGGTPAADAAARVSTWHEILGFLTLTRLSRGGLAREPAVHGPRRDGKQQPAVHREAGADPGQADRQSDGRWLPTPSGSVSSRSTLGTSSGRLRRPEFMDIAAQRPSWPAVGP
jgi:dienelactone hydrolase